MSRFLAMLSLLVGSGFLAYTYISSQANDYHKAILYAVVALNFMVLSVGMVIVAELEDGRK